jgi:DNA-nicking Smr family endonuclease
MKADDDLFEREFGDIKRLEHNQAPTASPKTASPSHSKREEGSEDVESGETLSFLRPGIQTSSLQKLKRGQFPIEATLDLHGLKAIEADARLEQFIRQAQIRGLRTVRIIHGKGHGSEGQQPILKSKVGGWLREFTAVLAYHSAPPKGGGTGAVDVLLRT